MENSAKLTNSPANAIQANALAILGRAGIIAASVYPAIAKT